MTEKFCPFRWGDKTGNIPRCVEKRCALWAGSECAIAKLAKAVEKEE